VVAAVEGNPNGGCSPKLAGVSTFTIAYFVTRGIDEDMKTRVDMKARLGGSVHARVNDT
jgi:hypothetical protein